MFLEKLLCKSGKLLPLHVLLYLFRNWKYIEEKNRNCFIENNLNTIMRKLNMFLKGLSIEDCEKVYEELKCVIDYLNCMEKAQDGAVVCICQGNEISVIAECSMWNIQRDYYTCSRHVCWDNNSVPFHISSNRYIAKYYADIIHCVAKGKKNSRICVVEIASGHGRLAVNLANIVRKARRDKTNGCSYPEIADYDITVVATDMHSDTFLELLCLPWVLELCRDGILDFGVCAAGESDSSDLHSSFFDIELLHGGGSLRRKHKETPYDQVIIMGNYAFDSFPCDLYMHNPCPNPDRVAAPGVCVPESEWWEIGTVDNEKRFSNRNCDSVGGSKGRNGGFLGLNDYAFGCQLVPPLDQPPILRALEKFLSSNESGMTSSGTYMVPVDGWGVLSKIRSCFDSHHPESTSFPQYTLITGDVALSPHDKGWQLEALGRFLEEQLNRAKRDSGVVPVFDRYKHCVLVKNLFPPHCSPSPSAVAFPLTPPVMECIFQEVFMRKSGSTSKEYSSYVTPIHGTNFQVSMYSTVPNITVNILSTVPQIAPEVHAVANPTQECRFSCTPADYFLLLEHAKNCSISVDVPTSTSVPDGQGKLKKIDSSVSLEWVLQFLGMGSDLVSADPVPINNHNYDTIAFQMLQWKIIRAYRKHCLLVAVDNGLQESCAVASKRRKCNPRQDVGETDTIRQLIRVCINCSRNQYSTSWKEYCAIRRSASQFLLALRNEVAVEECLTAFYTSSVRERCSDALQGGHVYYERLTDDAVIASGNVVVTTDTSAASVKACTCSIITRSASGIPWCMTIVYCSESGTVERRYHAYSLYECYLLVVCLLKVHARIPFDHSNVLDCRVVYIDESVAHSSSVVSTNGLRVIPIVLLLWIKEQLSPQSTCYSPGKLHKGLLRKTNNLLLKLKHAYQHVCAEKDT